MLLGSSNFYSEQRTTISWTITLDQTIFLESNHLPDNCIFSKDFTGSIVLDTILTHRLNNSIIQDDLTTVQIRVTLTWTLMDTQVQSNRYATVVSMTTLTYCRQSHGTMSSHFQENGIFKDYSHW